MIDQLPSWKKPEINLHDKTSTPKAVHNLLSFKKAKDLLIKIHDWWSLEITPEQLSDFHFLINQWFIELREPSHDAQILENELTQYRDELWLLAQLKKVVENFIELRDSQKSSWLFSILMRRWLVDLTKLENEITELCTPELMKRITPRIVDNKFKDIEKFKIAVEAEILDIHKRMDGNERHLEKIRKTFEPTTHVLWVGYFSVTEKWLKHIPEHEIIKNLQTVFNHCSGPGKYKMIDYNYFKDDPANIITHLFADPLKKDQIVDRIDDFETMAMYLEKGLFKTCKIQNVTIKNALTIRFLYTFWQDLNFINLHQKKLEEDVRNLEIEGIIPNSLKLREERFVYAFDLLFLQVTNTSEKISLIKLKKFFEQMNQKFEHLSDGQKIRMSIFLLPLLETWEKNISSLCDWIESIAKMLSSIPFDNMAERFMLAAHLFSMTSDSAWSLEDLVARFQVIDSRCEWLNLKNRLLQRQISIHALLSLDRLKYMGISVSSEEYFHTFKRILKKIDQNTRLVQILKDAWYQDNRPPLAINLTNFTVFPKTTIDPRSYPTGTVRKLEYKSDLPIPLLGYPFGTLMLS